jgi:hypothetical protein
MAFDYAAYQKAKAEYDAADVALDDASREQAKRLNLYLDGKLTDAEYLPYRQAVVTAMARFDAAYAVTQDIGESPIVGESDDGETQLSFNL